MTPRHAAGSRGWLLLRLCVLALSWQLPHSRPTVPGFPISTAAATLRQSYPALCITLRQRHRLSRQLKPARAKAAMRSLVAVALTLAGVLASVSADADIGKLMKEGKISKEQIEKIQADAKNEDLMSAVRKNDPAMLERVLAAAEDPAEEILLVGGDLKNLLHYAAIWHPGKEAVVPGLIEAGAQLNDEDQFGYTPIMLSASMGTASVMKHFIVSSQQFPSQPASRPAGQPSLPSSMCRLSRPLCACCADRGVGCGWPQAAGADMTKDCDQGPFSGMTALDIAYEKQEAMNQDRKEIIALLEAAGAPRNKAKGEL